MFEFSKHKKKIRLVKYIFFSAGICIAIVILYLFFKKDDYLPEGEESKQIGKTKLMHNYSLSINNTVFEGISSDLLPYKLIAQTVARNKDSAYFLNNLVGDYTVKDGTVTVKSIIGEFNEGNKEIDFHRGVELIYNKFTIQAHKLKLNFDTKEAVSNQPVSILFNNSRIDANSLETMQNSEIIELKNGVKASFLLDDFR